MRALKTTILFILVITPMISAGGETPSSSADRLFRMALKGETSFDGAVGIWTEELRRTPFPSAALYYNTANALALDGRDGKAEEALALYSMALTLRPGNRDFRYNRNLLLNERGLDIPDWSPVEGILWFPLWLLGLRGVWAVMGTAASAALLYMLLSLARRKIPSLSVILSALLFLLYGGSVLAGWEHRSAGMAVVRTEETRLYEGDSPLYPSTAVLKGGEELRILEERDGWYRVKTTAGCKEGWCEGFSLLRADDVVNFY